MSQTIPLSTTNKKRQDEKNGKAVKELSQQPKNRNCVECGMRGPTYVDMTTTSYCCATCAGVLRGLNPPHRIKSITMATFSQEDVDKLRLGGNELNDKTWLGLYSGAPDRNFATKEDRTKFITDKYERKKWYVSAEEVAKQEELIERAKESRSVQLKSNTHRDDPLDIFSSLSLGGESSQSQRPPPSVSLDSVFSPPSMMDCVPMNRPRDFDDPHPFSPPAFMAPPPPLPGVVSQSIAHMHPLNQPTHMPASFAFGSPPSGLVPQQPQFNMNNDQSHRHPPPSTVSISSTVPPSQSTPIKITSPIDPFSPLSAIAKPFPQESIKQPTIAPTTTSAFNGSSTVAPSFDPFASSNPFASSTPFGAPQQQAPSPVDPFGAPQQQAPAPVDPFGASQQQAPTPFDPLGAPTTNFAVKFDGDTPTSCTTLKASATFDVFNSHNNGGILPKSQTTTTLPPSSQSDPFSSIFTSTPTLPSTQPSMTSSQPPVHNTPVVSSTVPISQPQPPPPSTVTSTVMNSGGDKYSALAELDELFHSGGDSTISNGKPSWISTGFSAPPLTKAPAFPSSSMTSGGGMGSVPRSSTLGAISSSIISPSSSTTPWMGCGSSTMITSAYSHSSLQSTQPSIGSSTLMGNNTSISTVPSGIPPMGMGQVPPMGQSSQYAQAAAMTGNPFASFAPKTDMTIQQQPQLGGGGGVPNNSNPFWNPFLS